MYPLRVFISYTHADEGLVQQIERDLTDLGLKPVRDRNLAAGTKFDDGIRRCIAQAHVCMPFLTARSSERPWVQQEIGYALGIGIPVVPVACGAPPEGMISGLQVIIVREDLSDFRSRIVEARLESLVLANGSERELERLGVTTHVAEYSEERTRLLVRFAAETPSRGRVRQQAIFSSFSLPDAPATNPAWDAIDFGKGRSPGFRSQLREERRALEEHARARGCSLLLYPPADFSVVGPHVHGTQLELLRQFLVSIPKASIVVGIAESQFPGSITVVGDWFGARALPPRDGSEFRQTIFTGHAPTVLRWVREFDRELKRHLGAVGIRAAKSRDHAVSWIERRLAQLPTE
jgi:hypothetical protein